MDLTVDIGTKCNNRCLFCSAGARDDLETCAWEMSSEELKKKISMAAEMGHTSLTITGGEFTIRDDALEVLDFAVKQGLNNVLIQTNARKLSDFDFAKRFVDAGARNILVSIHGSTSEIHDSNTQIQGGFEETLAGIKNLVRLGVKPGTLMVITQKNFKDIINVVRMARDLGARVPALAYPMNCRSTRLNFDVIVPRYSDVAPHINDFFKELDSMREVSTIHCFPFCFMLGFEFLSHNILYPGDYDIYVSQDKIIKYTTKEYIKPEVCKKCDYHVFCDGISVYYYIRHGADELKPVRTGKLCEDENFISIEMPEEYIPCCKDVIFTGRSFGGFLVKKNYPSGLIVLNKKGCLLLSFLFGQNTLKEIEAYFGSSALNYIGFLYQKGMIDFSSEKQDLKSDGKSRAILKELGDINKLKDEIDKVNVYEYLLFSREKEKYRLFLERKTI